MSVLKVRPARITITPDGRRLYPCGCVDLPDGLVASRPFVFCARAFCYRQAVAR